MLYYLVINTFTGGGWVQVLDRVHCKDEPINPLRKCLSAEFSPSLRLHINLTCSEHGPSYSYISVGCVTSFYSRGFCSCHHTNEASVTTEQYNQCTTLEYQNWGSYISISSMLRHTWPIPTLRIGKKHAS